MKKTTKLLCLFLALLTVASVAVFGASARDEIVTPVESLGCARLLSYTRGSTTYTFTYDDAGRQVSCERKTTSDANVFSRFAFFYNDAGKLSKVESRRINVAESADRLAEYITFEYDAKGNLTVRDSYREDIMTGEPKPTEHEEMTYDANGNLTCETTAFWNSVSETWKPSEKYEYTFDANGNETRRSNFRWEDDSWKEVAKVETDYNANNLYSVRREYKEDYATGNLYFSDRYTATYDANGNLIREDIENTGVPGAELALGIVMKHTYNGKLRVKTEQEIHAPGIDPYIARTETRTYNEDGILIEVLTQTATATAPTPVNSGRQVIVPGANDQSNTTYFYMWSDNEWKITGGNRIIVETDEFGNLLHSVYFELDIDSPEEKWDDCGSEQTFVYETIHHITKVDAVDASCDGNGVKEYYVCDKCGKAYLDAEGKNEIPDLNAWKEADGKVDALEHSYVDGVCTHCGAKDPNGGNGGKGNVGTVILIIVLCLLLLLIIAYVLLYIYWRKKGVAIPAFLKPSFVALDKLFNKESPEKKEE